MVWKCVSKHVHIARFTRAAQANTLLRRWYLGVHVKGLSRPHSNVLCWHLRACTWTCCGEVDILECTSTSSREVDIVKGMHKQANLHLKSGYLSVHVNTLLKSWHLGAHMNALLKSLLLGEHVNMPLEKFRYLWAYAKANTLLSSWHHVFFKYLGHNLLFVLFHH